MTGQLASKIAIAAICLAAAISHPLAFTMVAAGGICLAMLTISAICMF